jgi:hypothetical protein
VVEDLGQGSAGSSAEGQLSLHRVASTVRSLRESLVSYALEHRLVIGIASSALFDLTEPDAVFREEGVAAYRRYQEEHLDDQLSAGMAFPLRRTAPNSGPAAPDGASSPHIPRRGHGALSSTSKRSSTRRPPGRTSGVPADLLEGVYTCNIATTLPRKLDWFIERTRRGPEGPDDADG